LCNSIKAPHTEVCADEKHRIGIIVVRLPSLDFVSYFEFAIPVLVFRTGITVHSNMKKKIVEKCPEHTFFVPKI
jgi:hypothetical protein